MDLDTLLMRPPALHTGRDGTLVSWRAGDRLLRYLDETLRPGDTTLETGAGISTLVFVMHRCRHTAVVPDRLVADRIMAWCAEHDLDTGNLEFRIAGSETVLPGLPDDPLDLVLIDGAHGFPHPFLDWFYAGRRLRAGGVVVVDDLQIWTGQVLFDFLAADSRWDIRRKVPREFFAAVRRECGPVGEWTDQPFVLKRSLTINSTSVVRRWAGRASIGIHLARTSADLVRRGQWDELRARVGDFLPRPGGRAG